MRRVEENRHASSLQLSKEVESQTGVTISQYGVHCTGAREQGVLRVLQHPLFFSVGNCKLL